MQLDCLCWALLNSTKEQIDLAAEEKTEDETYGAVEADISGCHIKTVLA